MLNEKVDIEVCGRRLTVEMDGLTQLEVHTLARLVSEKMQEIGRDSKIVDTQKLAILTAIELAADLSRLKEQLDEAAGIEGRRLDGMLLALEKALDSAPEKA